MAGRDPAPIHVPGTVMPYAALLALDPVDLRIVHAGGDTAGLLGPQPQDLVTRGLDTVIAPEHIGRLRALLRTDPVIPRPVPALVMAAADDATPVDVVAYQSTGLLVLEFQRRPGTPHDHAVGLVQGMIRRLRQSTSLEAFAAAIAAETRALLGFDRVVVTRFNPDGSFAVVGEARDDATGSLLGLHFPAADVPIQARALYLENWVREIADVTRAPAPLLPAVNPANGLALDLTHSTIGGVSPAYRCYLRDMGVAASLSLGLIRAGELWGLIACHHRTPRPPLSLRMRESCELFAEMVSTKLDRRLAAHRFDADVRSARLQDALLAQLSREDELAAGLIRLQPDLRHFIAATGVGLWIGGMFSGQGETPSPEQTEALVTWLNATPRPGVFHTDRLAALYPPAAQFPHRITGLLALSLSRAPRDFVLWFRPEVVRTVAWAGDPDRRETPNGDAAPGRFAAWRQQIRGQSSPWLDEEIVAARRLRVALLDIVLRRIDQIARERESARLRQAALAQELDQRVNQWRAAAEALQRETHRRAVLESELSDVLSRTVADQEAERRRIARELHDTLGQSLTLLQLGLSTLGEGLGDPSQTRDRVANLQALAADLARGVSRLAWEIRPTALDDLGLQTALRSLLEHWSAHTGIPFDLHLPAGMSRLPPLLETALYRVLQEALTNVGRHAKATAVGVILTLAEDEIVMVIEDNGIGFIPAPRSDAGTKRRTSLGVLGMRERLTLVGGTLEIESAPGQGTTLFARVPLPR